MRSTRFAVFAVLSLFLLPAFLVAQNDKTNQVKGSKQRPAEVEDQVTCTSYPEWTCLPQIPEAQSAETRPTETADPTSRASVDPSNCTSYPEWTCFPEANTAQGSKVVHAKKTKQRLSRESKPAAGLPAGVE